MYRVITIMADFGFGPYAWGKISIAERNVGTNIADSVSGFHDEYRVPKQLEVRFCHWAESFECHWDSSDFDWSLFHSEGLALAAELKQVLGSAFTVIYKKPIEDPDDDINGLLIL